MNQPLHLPMPSPSQYPSTFNGSFILRDSDSDSEGFLFGYNFFESLHCTDPDSDPYPHRLFRESESESKSDSGNVNKPSHCIYDNWPVRVNKPEVPLMELSH